MDNTEKGTKFFFNPKTQQALGAISDICSMLWQVYSTSLSYGFSRKQSFTLARDMFESILYKANEQEGDI